MSKVTFPKRKLDDWLTSYIAYTEAQEAPELFHTYVGLGVLSCLVNRNVYMDMGFAKIYPNIYLLLLAGAASARKTIALSIGKDMLRCALPDFPIFAQKGSPVALIKSLKERGEKEGKGYALIYNDEFVTFLGSNKDTKEELLGMLTTLYDCPSLWEYETIGRGKESIPNAWLTLMAGITPDTMKAAIPATAVGGGFTSRLLLVFQERSNKPRTYKTHPSAHLKEQLVNDAGIISSAVGEIKFAPEAEDWYRVWYEEIHDPDHGGTGLGGYYGRKHIILLRVAMLLALSRDDKLEVNDTDLKISLELLNEHEKYLPAIMGTLISEGGGVLTNRVLRYIEKFGEPSYAELMRGLSYVMGAKELQETIETLKLSGQIIEDVDTKISGRTRRVFRVNRGLK